MTSLVFAALVRALAPLLLFFSVFLLLTGHHHPGGGFTGGLVAASAFVLYATATTPVSARRALRVQQSSLIGGGLLLALGSGVIPLVRGQPFLTSVWAKPDLPVFGEVEVGTPLLFDLGVYFVVMGVTLAFVLSLAEE
jgi:multicomponent Na+:H+ antiporter subunit B